MTASLAPPRAASRVRRAFACGLFCALLLASCAATPNPHLGAANAEGVLAGFWLGLWHGVIAPLAFVLSLFKPDVGFYEVHNNGGWYNFGFLLGLTFWGGGSHGARRAKPTTTT